MLETRRRRRELERLLVVLVRADAINQAGGKRIATADAIDDVADVVVLAREELLAVVQHGTPAIAIGVVAFAKRDDLLLKIRKLLQHFFGERTVFLVLELTAFHVDVHLDAKSLLTIFFIRDADRRERNELTHDLRRFLPVAPQVLSIVVIARNCD